MSKNITVIHRKLTSNSEVEKPKDLILLFAKELGWSPSYYIKPSKEEKSNGYLVIEHGLQNSAIISFLNTRNEDLTNLEEENLLSLSYNNLVNWHITIDEKFINYYYILNKEKRKVETLKIEIGNEENALSVKTFYQIIEKKPNTNVRALDDVLIENISNWKRIIYSELGYNVDIESLSHLFNAIIFLRSIEDSWKRENLLKFNEKLLLDIISKGKGSTLYGIVVEAENLLVTIPEFIVDKKRLELFNKLDINDTLRFLNSFYENDYKRFKYDFSIMTKQALSRIYQKYVSILSISEPQIFNNNLFNFPEIPFEKINKNVGAYYTPEYIARFFAKYICKKFTEKELENMSTLEPAVGSGIFLRTFLEAQIEERLNNNSEIQIDKLFNNVVGIDIDQNACLATNLSLSLLHYVFNKQLKKPNVINGDSIKIMQDNISSGKSYDIIISNPPYINQNNKEIEFIETNKKIMYGLTNGKVDIYQVFLKLSIDLLSPNGLGLFVLPHNFLNSESSKKLRKYLLEKCTIEAVADLSSINVFENVSTYTILLIFRKHPSSDDSECWLLKCRNSVGEALNHLLLKSTVEQKQFQVYKAKNYFKDDEEWHILNKSEYTLYNKIKSNRRIDDFLKLNQGVVTGKDSVFITKNSQITKREKSLYKKILSDRNMSGYISDTSSSDYVFYPYKNNVILKENEIKETFTQTWKYLENNKDKLLERGKVKSGKLSWWKLHSPGNPVDANSPKIVCPYISITPKFSLDLTGDIITSRSPYFTLKENTDFDLFYYFLGILNSIPCYWVLSLQSQKQAHGYNIFSISILKKAPVPDPTLAENFRLVTKMIHLVKLRMIEKNHSKQFEIENNINSISCDLYKFTQEERKLLGYSL